MLRGVSSNTAPRVAAMGPAAARRHGSWKSTRAPSTPHTTPQAGRDTGAALEAALEEARRELEGTRASHARLAGERREFEEQAAAWLEDARAREAALEAVRVELEALRREQETDLEAARAARCAAEERGAAVEEEQAALTQEQVACAATQARLEADGKTLREALEALEADRRGLEVGGTVGGWVGGVESFGCGT